MKFSNTFTKGGLLVALLVLLANFVMAQRTVKGTVSDAETGETLIGATVTVVGTTRGAVTDIDGNYSVEVPAGSTQLRFAYTGYTEQVLTLGASNTVDVAMASANVLDEVVVVGYGTIKAKEVTSAVVSVKAEDFNKGNVTSPAQLIQGKVAGLTITRPGSDPNGGFNLRLRGISSTQSGIQPLIVIDGVPGADLSLVDPNDIASIDVQKDGSAAAIYGTRASAGVILVTTKRGNAGRTVADYNGFVAFDTPARRYKTLNAADFVRLGGTDLSPNDDTDTDWFNEITQTGISNVHNLSLSGGAGSGTFRASFNYRDVQGILRNSGLNQYNASLGFSQKVLNNRVTLDGNLFMTARNSDFGFQEAFRYSVVNNPTAGITSSDAEYEQYGGYVEKPLFDYFNPVAMIEQNTNKGKTNRLLGNIQATYQVLPGLNAKVNLSQERSNSTYGQYYTKQSRYRGKDRNGLGSLGEDANISNLLEFTGDYTRRIGKNRLNILGGYSWQQFEYSGLRAEGGNILTNALENNNLSAFRDFRKGLGTVTSYRGEDRLIAFFGRARFNINDIVNLEAGVRREGSTRFGDNNKWGLFPFASGSVDIAKLASVNGVNALKLRGGYGVTGNRPVSNNRSRLVFSPGSSFYYNGSYVDSYGPTRNPNADLKWEEKAEINVGLDFSFLDYKLNGSLDLYRRKTNDLIQEVAVPQPPNLAGLSIVNIGAFTNKGIEATLNYKVIDKKDLTWTPSIVFSAFRATLNDFGRPDTVPYAVVGAPGQNDVRYTILYNGAPLGQLWGPVRESVDSDGKITYKDIDGDGVQGQAGVSELEGFNQDQTRLGNGLPKFELGLNNSFTFGRFDLNFFLRGVFGHDLVNEYRVFYESLDASASTWNKVDTKYFDENVKAANRFDNTHVENATFVKLDNATLGYNFKLPAGSWFNKARVYVSGQNLITITNYTGVDPEARLEDSGPVDNGGTATGNPLAFGIDRRSTFFLARTISFGVNFGF